MLSVYVARDGGPPAVALGAGVAHDAASTVKVAVLCALYARPMPPPYVVAVCYTGALATGHAVDDPAARLIARISADVWERRDRLHDPHTTWPDWATLGSTEAAR